MKLLPIATLLALSACANTPALDLCKYSDVRRATYATTIRAIDLYAMGRPLPYEMALGRTAAVTALAILDRNCPVVTE